MLFGLRDCLIGACLSLCCPLAYATSRQTLKPDLCFVSGIVSDILSGEPLKGSRLQLLPISAESDELIAAERRQMGIYAPDLRSPFEARSQSDGRFCFTGVPSGQYTLVGRKPGFIDTNYGSATPFQAGSVIGVKSDETLSLSVQLIPQATITGRVTNLEGDGVENGVVQLVRRVWLRGKYRHLVVAGVRPNDLGEYRFARLASGTYYVLFLPQSLSQEPGRTVARGHVNHHQQVRTFHPSGGSLREGRALQITAGLDCRNVDILVRENTTYLVGGRLQGAVQSTNFAAMNLLPEDEEMLAFTADGGRLKPDNTFEFANIAPGSYRLTFLGASNRGNLLASTQVSVTDHDLDSVTLDIAPPISITGNVSIEGIPVSTLSGSEVRLVSADALLGPSVSARVKGDGTFILEGCNPGKYLVAISPPPGTYVKSVRYGSADITNQSLVLSSAPASLEISYGSGVAQLAGIISDQNDKFASKPVRYAYYFVVPKAMQIDGAGSRSGLADGNGRFVAKDLVPGKYLVFAFYCPDPGAMNNRFTVEALAPLGVEIEVAEYEKRNLSLNVISPSQAAAIIEKQL